MSEHLVCHSTDLIKWFNSPIPAFDNRIPLDILKEDGEEELFGYMQTIPC